MQKRSLLSQKYPEIAREFDSEKNKGIDVTELSVSDTTKYWWKCENEHSWCVTVKTRTCRNKDRNAESGYLGCPYCNGKINVRTEYPEIIETFWDFKKNTRDPSTLGVYSRQEVYWRCKEGHSFKKTVVNMIKSKREPCPICARTVLKRGVNDLVITHPVLVQQWDYKRNKNLKPEDFTSKSKQLVWWCCSNCGYEWKNTINKRTRNVQGTCPKCMQGSRTSYAEQYIYYRIKNIFEDAESRKILDSKTKREADIFIPELQLCIEYDGARFHKTQKAKVRDAAKYRLCKEKGITLLRITEINELPVEDIIEETAEVGIKKSDYVMYIRNIHTKEKIEELDRVVLKIKEWLEIKYNLNLVEKEYDKHILECKVQEQLGVCLGDSSLADKFPSILQYFDTEKNGVLNPTMLAPNSHLKVWWVCAKCGDAYSMQIATRIRNIPENSECKCPSCTKKETGRKYIQATKGVDDIGTILPVLLIDWDFDSNDELPEFYRIHSNKAVNWKCHKCGETWTNRIEKEALRKQRGSLGCVTCAKELKRIKNK